ncbi:hypothetical protein [Mycobacteroides abscessus]|uniref:hypothetical protein n=1 Tax=Mycobacteroides abscessus TaxID=36809 RepID=UPI00092802D7|nr:hypothetical protein [Mycobacteroides abscessus]SIF25765.1 Uncharacterised protein [Mycobacteroides abscessus subsp. abscessus]SIF38915.1 Uncharacterised protein [Mycobacteroides abscessus subsp. abscessus]SIF83420.1 Uncharacterised protein [Mycobacteroides abscessus subsp. abscessus]
MSKFGFATAIFISAAIADSCAAAPASAAGGCDDPASSLYASDFCKGVRELQTYGTTAPAPTTPSTSSGGSGVTGFISEHAGLIVFAFVALLAFAVIKGWRESAAEDAKKAAQQEQAALDRGRNIALDHHAERVQQAREAVAWSAPDPSTYDPMGLGVAPPQMPEPDLPDAPPSSPADLKRYSIFGAVVPWVPGSAFAALVARDGDITRAEQAWVEACRAARLGETDSETGAFTPTAELTNVRNVVGSGDVELVVLPADLFTGDVQLNRVIPYLVRTARVRWSGVFEREHTSDSFVIRLSNTDPAAQAPGALQQQAPADPASGWEW